MAESSEGEQEGKLSRGNQPLVADDDLCKMAKKAAWSVSSCKPGNGVVSLRDDNLYTYWQHYLIENEQNCKVNMVEVITEFFSSSARTASQFPLGLVVNLIRQWNYDGIIINQLALSYSHPFKPAHGRPFIKRKNIMQTYRSN